MDASSTPPYPALGVAARGIVRGPDGGVLLVRRSPRSHVDPGCWELPGGKMDFGERLVDALVREVREETGLTVGGGRPVHVAHFTKEPFWVTCVTFVCDSFDGEVILSSEHDAFAWVTPADVGGLPLARTMAEQLEAALERPAARGAAR